MSVKNARTPKSLAVIAAAMLSVLGAGTATAQQYEMEQMLEAYLQEKAELRQADAEKQAEREAARAEQSKAEHDPA